MAKVPVYSFLWKIPNAQTIEKCTPGRGWKAGDRADDPVFPTSKVLGEDFSAILENFY